VTPHSKSSNPAEPVISCVIRPANVLFEVDGVTEVVAWEDGPELDRDLDLLASLHWLGGDVRLVGHRGLLSGEKVIVV
jgi:hypothetical protein